jgi:D-beta-D-heptose 7-phosphate kinase/D-beta-D-heptose 1-phosphate adenosyltransferase
MKYIFVNGTFDILHTGHLSLLKYAKSLGSVTVGIDSDQRVKLLKGPQRPINTQDERKEMLLALKYVDNVTIFNSDDELVQLVSACDIMVKGADYKNKPVIGQDSCKQIIFFDIIYGQSTTEKIKRITNRR